MTQREKTLSVAVAAAGLLWAGTRGLAAYREVVDHNSAEQIAAEEALGEAHTAEARGLRAHAQLNEWRRRSLPTNRDVASSLYQDWLRSQLTGAGLEVNQLSDKSLTRRNGQFVEISVEAHATGSLAQLTDFLYRFYTSPHLHRISSATVTPGQDNKDKLNATFTIDALILPDCPRSDKLAEGHQQRLPATLDELRDRITGRNVFAIYQPKKAGGSDADAEAAGATLTGISSGARGLRLDVFVKDGGKMLHFYEGDSIHVGKFEGKVVEIDGRRAVVETAKGRVELRLGHNLGEAAPLNEQTT